MRTSPLLAGLQPARVVSTALARLYAYIGAHDKPLRAENEIDRARQRTIMPFAAIVWIFVFHETFATPLRLDEQIWLVCAAAYGVASVAFWLRLLRHPTAGVHARNIFSWPAIP